MTINGNEIKGLIFDYGGTLDTGGNHWGKVIWHAYRECRVPAGEALFREAYVYAERELARHPIIQSHYTFRQTLAAKLRIEMEYIGKAVPGFSAEQWHAPVLDTLYRQTLEHTRRSAAVLARLKEAYPMVLVSNFYGNIGTVLSEFGLNGMFGSIIESAVVGVRKPDPRIFSIGVEAIGLPAQQVAVVGDSYSKDIVAGKKAGCHTVWIKGEGWTPAEEQGGPDADLVIAALEELLP